MRQEEDQENSFDEIEREEGQEEIR